MKDNLSKRDLLSTKYHQLSRSNLADSFASHTRTKQMRSSRQGVTYDPKSHVDKRLQLRVLSVCSCADIKQMVVTKIISILTNNNIHGKFDPDDSQKVKLVLDLFLNKDDPLAMEE